MTMIWPQNIYVFAFTAAAGWQDSVSISVISTANKYISQVQSNLSVSKKALVHLG